MSELFPNRVDEAKPVAIIKVDLPDINDFKFTRVELVGAFYRVIPKTGKEVYFLRSLQKNMDLFVPESGNRLLVSSKIIDQLV